MTRNGEWDIVQRYVGCFCAPDSLDDVMRVYVDSLEPIALLLKAYKLCGDDGWFELPEDERGNELFARLFNEARRDLPMRCHFGYFLKLVLRRYSEEEILVSFYTPKDIQSFRVDEEGRILERADFCFHVQALLFEWPESPERRLAAM